ncbi:MAG: hypothetical protein OJJ55_04220 [Rhodococcus sp.]|nr:hypothetical protein [Rhodococcus sp. (in: high G+C Gram-positive bacteria)]
MSMPFTYAYLEQMLETTIKAGYRVSSFADYDDAYERTVILRHDVDYTLDGLLFAATMERDLGCTASYLFRIHADEYNLFSCVSWNTVQQVKALGHEVGLHFEGMNAGRALDIDPAVLIAREKAVLEAMLGEPVLTGSEHRELSGTIHGTPLFDEAHDPYALGFKYYAMDPRYCREMKYLSDSNAHWREGDLLQHLGKHPRFQVLIHLDWWFEKDLLLKGPYYHPRGTHI